MAHKMRKDMDDNNGIYVVVLILISGVTIVVLGITFLVTVFKYVFMN
jgi:hypothetical protein